MSTVPLLEGGGEGSVVCAKALGWREGCGLALNMGTPCSIFTAAWPALVHPSFPSTIPLSFLCLESVSLHSRPLREPTQLSFGVSSATITARTLTGASTCPLAGGLGMGWLRTLDVPVSIVDAKSPGLVHTVWAAAPLWGRVLQVGVQDRGCRASPPVSSQVRALLLARRRMRQAGQRYSCPASD